MSYFPFYFAEKTYSNLRIGAEGGSRTHKRLVLNQPCLPVASLRRIGAGDRNRTCTCPDFKFGDSALGLHQHIMEPRNELASFSPAYETGNSLSSLTGQ